MGFVQTEIAATVDLTILTKAESGVLTKGWFLCPGANLKVSPDGK